ncbi:RTA-like protein [Penicillium digitatum]|uniref:Conidiation protein Con-6 n=3 Tax=Penicillium digitatum TaxID=36651 RepID=K9FFU9_PEND2|nr:hypothetical protein PDIP_78180 [Penicillium digitatum Pd1]EKV06633.1 hypothetical protein PDIP_78180 [Penicillium digitatum Pd1]EKV08315.1 hypothetical protein PDIG_68900 [Penicillium digitatum PHI26]KAG0160942.1 hypothetical protein PDIDSM_8474 [Penicillium digitatum]QQK40783.1 RTA-like protein [Penicillium digitatum]
MSSLGEAKDVDLPIEDEVSARRGYTAALSNPKVSKKDKRNALDLLNDEIGGDAPRHYLDEGPDRSKDPSDLAGVESAERESYYTPQGEK